MVVDDLDRFSVAARPAEADAPLIVDADAVPPRAPTDERLESIPGRHSEFIEPDGRIHDAELPEHDAAEVGRVAPDRFALPEALGVAVSEAANHNE